MSVAQFMNVEEWQLQKVPILNLISKMLAAKFTDRPSIQEVQQSFQDIYKLD
jgi:hypothetical protein